MSLHGSVADNLCGGTESRQKLWSGKMHADTDQLRDRKGTDHTEYSALFSTLIFFCSQILTDKSSNPNPWIFI